MMLGRWSRGATCACSMSIECASPWIVAFCWQGASVPRARCGGAYDRPQDSLGLSSLSCLALPLRIAVAVAVAVSR